MAKAGTLLWDRRAWASAVFSIALAFSGLAGTGQAAQSAPKPALAKDPLEILTQWNNDYRRRGAGLDQEADYGIRTALETLRRRFWLVEASENQALVLVCDLASIGGLGSTAWISRGNYLPDARETGVREAARSVLRSALDAASGQGRGQWLASNVLGDAATQPIPRRIAVADALVGRHWEVTLLPLFAAAAAPERGLREAAVAALAGWNSEAVSRYLAGMTVRALREPEFLSTDALLAHFTVHRLPADSSASAEVASALTKTVISSDWRAAIRHIPLSRTLPNELAVPHLIEALSLWTNRGLQGGASRRVEAALISELELRSGRHLGPAPDRWAYWWKATRLKEPESGGTSQEPNSGPPEQITQATFFGLRPWTDRVVFVIDRSGSMAEGFGTHESTSYAEALRQMGVFLEQLGPRAHFDLVLFSDQVSRWSGNLRPATPAQIESAMQWARRQPPRGGTMLRPAINEVLELNSRTGQPDLDRLEADTVVVLCDGATSEGSFWVAPLFQAIRNATCLRFDCVQIGNSGNGTLEVLAKESGGQFVRIDR